MPRRDGTGPMGMGSRTGRGFGNCINGNINNNQNTKNSSNNELLLEEKRKLEKELQIINEKLRND